MTSLSEPVQDLDQVGLWLESGVSACHVWEDSGHQHQEGQHGVHQ
jgi:hypothetical protein